MMWTVNVYNIKHNCFYTYRKTFSSKANATAFKNSCNDYSTTNNPCWWMVGEVKK